MSRMLKTGEFSVDLDSTVFAAFSDNDFHGTIRENKYSEIKGNEDYKSYPIYFDAKMRHMVLYMDKPISYERVCDSHVFDYKFTVALRDMHIQENYQVNENETECMLILESSRDYEKTTLKFVEKFKKTILEDPDFLELKSESMNITRCVVMPQTESLMIRKSSVYYVGRDRDRLTINIKHNDGYLELYIKFKTEDECKEKYKQIMEAI